MSKHIYIGNVSPTVTLQDLSELFCQCGSVEKVTILKGHSTNRLSRTAFISMSEPSDAATAVRKFNGHLLEGRPITVSEYQHSEEFAGQ
ncbi:MAG: splicing factor, CC1-like family [Verrucomicrobiales bacterium]|nr:splicing factor, CC1-like family [Verrucomicrobiales bacterium]